MISQVFNNFYVTCSAYSQAAVEHSKPILTKTAEIAKNCFAHLNQFARGFCVGTVATAFSMVFLGNSSGYVFRNDVKFILLSFAICSVAGGVFIGIVSMIQPGRRNSVF